MESTTAEIYCVECGNDNAVVKCGGCLEDFCYKHYGNHREELNEQLDEIETNRDLIRQSLFEPLSHPKKHLELQRIDQWELDAINEIKQEAEAARLVVLNYMYRHSSGIRIQLKNLSDRLKEARKENDFMEYHLNEWNKQLTELKEKLIQLSNVKVTYGSTYVVTNIIVDVPCKLRLHSMK